jgi:MFS family permease
LVIGVPIALPALRALLPPGTLRAAAGTPAAIAALGLLAFAFFGAEAFLPLSLTVVRGERATVGGLALTAATLTWTTGAWLQARLSVRSDRRRLAGAGFLLSALGIAGTSSTLRPEIPVWVSAIGWGTAGLGIGLAFSTLTLIVLERAKGQEGSAATALQLANVLGVALGTGVGGATLDLVTATGRSEALAIAWINFIMIAAAGLGIATTRRLPAYPPEGSTSGAALAATAPLPPL